jgi:L-seryl-tRNA(Ser) seleniumtransferase
MVPMSLSDLPSISSLIADPRMAVLPHALAVRAARLAVDEARAIVLAGGTLPEDLPGRALDRAELLRRGALRRVINATGIVIHTNLGRAPMAAEAVDAAADVARGFANLEMTLDDGKRGGRLSGVVEHAIALSGAEAAIAVNNNAAAVLMVLTALAQGREVLVSRGELVEIGGSFRVPDIVSAGGARLVEVGTTNRTRVADFAAAITDRTALILRVHPSNFKLVGFTERPDREALVALGLERGIPVVEDLGSGLLGPGLTVAGHAGDPAADDHVARAVAAGLDLVCFSADKLLGGPQAGVIVGRAEAVERLRSHPIYRAMRLDKMTLAALETTLRMIREGRADEIPVRAMLAKTPAECRAVAERIAAGIPGAQVEDDVGYSGGGALPGEALPTVVVVLRGGNPDARSAALRGGDPPIVARVARDAVVIDPRTLLPGDEEQVMEALNRLIDGR